MRQGDVDRVRDLCLDRQRSLGRLDRNLHAATAFAGIRISACASSVSCELRRCESSYDLTHIQRKTHDGSPLARNFTMDEICVTRKRREGAFEHGNTDPPLS
jgi:hypothetical protein